jgi:uncharacterized protein
MMKINVIELKRAIGNSEPFHFITPAGKLFAAEEFPEWLDANVEIQGRIENNGHFLEITGIIHAIGHFQCNCCLEPYTVEMPISFADSFCEGVGNEEQLDFVYFCGDEIDITDLVRESILLAEPLKPMCKADCLGLCPECGVNLNVNTCACNKEFIDPRLAVLKQFLK